MKAVQYTAPGQLKLTTVPEPEPSADQVVVRMNVAAICGSDLHFLHDSPSAKFPFAPGQSGHECVGLVEDADHAQFHRGQRVLVIPPQYNAFAEYLAVAPRWLLPLPDHVDAAHGLLAQQLGTVIFCCRKLGNVLDKTVVVVGQGPAGLLFTALLYRMGAKQIIGLDVVDHRLEVALTMGAVHTVHVGREDPAEAVEHLTDGHMADVVVEAVGEADTVNLCAELARPRGEVAFFGVPKRELMPVALGAFLRKNLTLVTSVEAQAEPNLRSFRLALDLIAQGRIDPAPLISHRIPFDQTPNAFDLAQTKRDGAVKVLLEFADVA